MQLRDGAGLGVLALILTLLILRRRERANSDGDSGDDRSKRLRSSSRQSLSSRSTGYAMLSSSSFPEMKSCGDGHRDVELRLCAEGERHTHTLARGKWLSMSQASCVYPRNHPNRCAYRDERMPRLNRLQVAPRELLVGSDASWRQSSPSSWSFVTSVDGSYFGRARRRGPLPLSTLK